MSTLSSGFFNKHDITSIIKLSNYNVFYNSRRNYENKYYSLINLLHEFKEDNLDCGNNGLWKLKISAISINSFNNYFIGAWGNRSNFFSDNISIDHINNSIDYIKKTNQVSLICPNSIEYLSDFIKNVFNNKNPWPTLIYFSKFISTFLPDLAIPFDTASLNKIARDYRISGDTKKISDYVSIHNKLKKDLISFLNNNNITVVNFKELDDFTLLKQKTLFSLNQTPLNRPIDKIYYSV
jgi:hypothetical protein